MGLFRPASPWLLFLVPFPLQENVSCLNTSLVILMLARRKAKLPFYINALREKEYTEKYPGCLLNNFHSLLRFWQRHYLNKDKDSTCLENVSRCIQVKSGLITLNVVFTCCVTLWTEVSPDWLVVSIPQNNSWRENAMQACWLKCRPWHSFKPKVCTKEGEVFFSFPFLRNQCDTTLTFTPWQLPVVLQMFEEFWLISQKDCVKIGL